MITSKYCYLRDNCKKKFSGPTTCKEDDIFCLKLFKIDTLYNSTLLSDKQRIHLNLYPDANGADLDNFKLLKSIEDHIIEFVNNGKNLYIHSTITGNGKTSWAIRFIQAYILKIWPESNLDNCPALFINVPRFLLALKDNITNKSDYISHIKEHILDADLVVWDEVGVKTLSEYDHENLLNLINTRLDEGKSNIYTSNLPPEELKEKVGDRLYSRIVNISTDIELFGADKRALYK